jgi:putative ABC transport system ATP-binding protein
MNHFPNQLSGGECQRVAIARALVVEPKLLLADEPSGNLDAETGVKVMDKFFEATKKHGTTTILVTHSLELARRCQRIFLLKDGKLVENFDRNNS